MLPDMVPSEPIKCNDAQHYARKQSSRGSSACKPGASESGGDDGLNDGA